MSAFQSTTSPAHLLLQPELTNAARSRRAFADVREAAALWRLALTLGWFDIRLRYRGSVLGPFWLTLSTAVMVAALGFLYSRLFKMELHDYLPFLALSIVLWNFLSALVGDACVCFTQAESMIRSARMPHTLHAVRVVVRNLLTLAHNVVVIIAIYAIYNVWPGWDSVVALPAILIWVADGLAICLLLGPLCARFRDIPPIVASVMQIAFFISPIIWQPSLLHGEAQRLLWLNPFFTVLEIVRAPLLGYLPAQQVWFSALAYSILLWVIAWALFTRVRGRLAFWV